LENFAGSTFLLALSMTLSLFDSVRPLRARQLMQRSLSSSSLDAGLLVRAWKASEDERPRLLRRCKRLDRLLRESRLRLAELNSCEGECCPPPRELPLSL
jgi:hypothetical protein